jgi:hypothetical protein
MGNLEVLGRWFKRSGNRDKIFLASKFGLVMGENVELKGIDSSADYCRKVCEESLAKLGTSTIDLCESSISIALHSALSTFFLILNIARLCSPYQPADAYRGNNASNGDDPSARPPLLLSGLP